MARISVSIWWLLLVAVSPAQTPAAAVDYDRDVRPILARHCLKCHGQDTQEGGLDLSQRTSATRLLESGRQAIVPGDLEASELWSRIANDDAAMRMPPDSPALSDIELQQLRQWIVSGSNWSTHWSYRKLAKPSVPLPKTLAMRRWCRNPIDCFVAVRLEQTDLTPAPPARTEDLLRRLYVDLVGLPPTPADRAGIPGESSDAFRFEEIVEQLLSSPKYGERWARHWLDLVHYAETHGHDQDRPRDHSWPYRDYVIRAFNEDRPYARFVQEQIAGDLLFPEEPWSQIGTGMLAAGPWDESSLRDIREDSLDREVARYLDRDDVITTVMSTFQSTSAHCARCHDHKFDPLTQTDYYALQAVFAGTDKANRLIDLDSEVAAQRRWLRLQLENLESQIAQRDAQLQTPAMAAAIADWERQFAQELARWTPLDSERVTSTAGVVWGRLPDGSWLATGASPDKETTVAEGRMTGERISALRIEVLDDESLPQHGPGRQPENGNLHLSEVRVFVVRNSEPTSAFQWQPVPLKAAAADFNQDGWTAAHAMDGNPNTAWGIHPQEGQRHQALFRFQDPVALKPDEELRVELVQHHGNQHTIGRLRLSVSSDDEAALPKVDQTPQDMLALLSTPAAERSDEQRWKLIEFVRRETLLRQLSELPAQTSVYCGTSDFVADGSFRPAAAPRPVFLLQRGNIQTPLQEVSPASLGCIEGMDRELEIRNPSNEAERRAGLARWISSGQNGLTWRSIANRVWQYHFGRGLVDTPNDFGQMGEYPSHPELLEWLACELRDHGGSLKHLHRLITTSAVYGQSTQANSDAAAVDAGNRLLWRMNRRKLDAETFRDSLLAITGTLVDEMGGPSDRQFAMSPGVHVTPVVEYEKFAVDQRTASRRSIYRFVFRTIPDPFLESLDCPDASQLTPKRTESITALQALATLHDKFVVRQCEILASQLATAERSGHDPVQAAFQRIFGRDAVEWELTACREYVQQHGFANLCRYLLNSNEFMFIE